MGICEVLIPLTNSASVEVQGNSAAALGNLSSKGMSPPHIYVHQSMLPSLLDSRTSSEDYAAFNDVWDKPNGGLHAYLHRFLTNSDPTFQHIAVWTVVQLLESGGTLVYLHFDPIVPTCLIDLPCLDPTLTANIRSSSRLISNIRSMAQSPPTSDSSSLGSRSHRTLSQSYEDTDHGEGAGEIAALAKRILDFAEGNANVFRPIGSAQPHTRADVTGGNEDSGDEDQLRKSVREALGVPGSHDGQY